MRERNVLDHIFTVDNVLSPTHLKLLTDTAKATNFEWNYLPNTHSDYTINPLNSYGLVHNLYDYKNQKTPSKHWGVFIAPLLVMIDKAGFEFHSLLRARVNCTMSNAMPHDGYPHIDDLDQISMYSAIFYIEDSDGPTILYTHMRESVSEIPYLDAHPDVDFVPAKLIDPIKNTGFIFNGNIYHSGMIPEKHQTRTLINYNFLGKKK
jgi:hypothetical protein